MSFPVYHPLPNCRFHQFKNLGGQRLATIADYLNCSLSGQCPRGTECHCAIQDHFARLDDQGRP